MSKYLVRNPWFRKVFRDTYEEACRFMENDAQKAVEKYQDHITEVERGEDEIRIHLRHHHDDFFLLWKVEVRG